MAILYGFHNVQEILDRRVAEVPENVVFDAMAAAAAAHNQDLNDAMSIFVQTVQEHQVGVGVQTENELQPVDEWGRPDPVRFPPPAARAFPLKMAQTSIALNYVLSQKMTVQDLNDRLENMFLADTRWMRRQLLGALFTNVPYAFADPQYGGLTVTPLANNDTEQYFRTNGSIGVDTHHKGSAAMDAAMMVDLHDELVEHDLNGGADAQVVALIATNLVATAKALPGFVNTTDPNVTAGTGNDQYVGSFAATAPGTPIGYDEDARVHLREWPTLPSNYVVGITNGAVPPIAMREDPEASLRGFGEIPGRTDMPYLQRIWSRRAGFGAYNRVGAVVYQTNNVTYSIPTGYQQPF